VSILCDARKIELTPVTNPGEDPLAVIAAAYGAPPDLFLVANTHHHAYVKQCSLPRLALASPRVAAASSAAAIRRRSGPGRAVAASGQPKGAANATPHDAEERQKQGDQIGR
jgi:hypothetical protein